VRRRFGKAEAGFRIPKLNRKEPSSFAVIPVEFTQEG
jgi:hypothetical protein